MSDARDLLREALPRLAHGSMCRYMTAHGGCTCGYVQLKARITAHLSAEPNEGRESALQQYKRLMVESEEPSAVERLRFYLSLALKGQDWLDVEQFIDAIPAPQPTATESRLAEVEAVTRLATIEECAKVCGEERHVCPPTHNEVVRLLVECRAALSAAERRAEAMKRALIDLRHTSHYECDDPWYSCPLSAEGCADGRQVGCTCGTEAHNNRIDAALASGAGEAK